MTEEQMIEAMARAIMIARDNGGCIVKDWEREERDNPHVAQVLRQARAALDAIRPTLAALQVRAEAAEAQAKSAIENCEQWAKAYRELQRFLVSYHCIAHDAEAQNKRLREALEFYARQGGSYDQAALEKETNQ